MFELAVTSFNELRTVASLTQTQLGKLIGTTASVICRLRMQATKVTPWQGYAEVRPSQISVYRKWNQFRLPNPLVPLPRKTINNLCTPCAPETGIGKVCHACQPPVTGKVAWATIGPEMPSR